MSSPAAPVSPGSSKSAPRSRRWQRALPWLGGGLLIALVAVGLWPKPIAVEMATVGRGPLVVTVNEEGMTRVKNRYVISAPVGGQLRRIDWKAGAAVEAGKTELAILETSGADFLDARTQAQATARVRGAEANRDRAAAQRERARAATKMSSADFSRVKKLFEERTLSRQEFDASEMRDVTALQDERSAEFSLQVAEYELQQAKAVLARGEPGSAANGEPLVITSPVSGRILRVLQESSRVVPAGFPLMEVGDPSDLEARIEVLSRDGVAIQPGARVRLEQWGGAEPLEGRVRLVEPAAFTKISALGVEEQRVYVVVDFVEPVTKRPSLGDSYRVEARIVTWEGANVLRVPAGALFQRGGLWQTFVIQGGVARLRTLKVGHGNGVETEILEGLSEGDRVAVYPGDKVSDGARVALIEAANR